MLVMMLCCCGCVVELVLHVLRPVAIAMVVLFFKPFHMITITFCFLQAYGLYDYHWCMGEAILLF